MIYLMPMLSPPVLPDRDDTGVVQSPRRVAKTMPYRWWNGDNNVFTTVKGQGFDHDMFLNFLFHEDLLQQHRDSCLFVVSPDVITIKSNSKLPNYERLREARVQGYALPTIEKFTQYGPIIRDAGYPAGLAAHDGFLDVIDQVDWGTVDYLFLGGSNWKLGPEGWEVTRIARSHGKRVHLGRVNSFKRLKLAHDMGCHSADGTLPVYGPDIHTPRIASWLDRINGQDELPQD